MAETQQTMRENRSHEPGISIRSFAGKILYFAVVLITAWCVMLLAHEAGHLLGGYLSGATLREFELRPWKLPYSLHNPNPHPLITLWAGPVLGVVGPLLVLAIWSTAVTRLIAGFCLLANGVYLAVGGLTGDRFLDTAQLLEAGASPLAIGLYCLITCGGGYLVFRRELIFLWTNSPGSEAR